MVWSEGNPYPFEIVNDLGQVVMRIDADGIYMPVPGSTTDFVRVGYVGNATRPQIIAQSGLSPDDNYVAMGLGTFSDPYLKFRNDLASQTWTVSTNSENWSFGPDFGGSAGFGIHKTVGGQGGVYFVSSQVGNEVVYDDATGFLKSGQVSPWSTEDWITPGLPVGWTNSGTEPLQYKIFPDGMVRLRGTISNTGGVVQPDGTTVFTLPSFYRPAQLWIAPNSYRGINTTGRIVVNTTGTVQMYGAPNTQPSFDSVAFSKL